MQKRKRSEAVYLPKRWTDAEMATRFKNRPVDPGKITHIFRDSVDVYDVASGRLLLRFRKGALPYPQIADQFYNGCIPHVRKRCSSARGNTTGESTQPGESRFVHSMIAGYFDHLSIRQNSMLKARGVQLAYPARETLFTAEYPEQFQKLVPFVEAVDLLYRRHAPRAYARQVRKARETHYRIGETAFSTVTINLNYQTTLHRDKNDDPEGFGNLSVIERGRYTGGELCLPQWGVGIDVRQGDVLFMNVHEWHGNLPLHLEPGAERMSVVCYFMPRIWRATRGVPEAELRKNMDLLRTLRQDIQDGFNIYHTFGTAKARKRKKKPVEELL